MSSNRTSNSDLDHDLRMLPEQTDEEVVFFGGKAEMQPLDVGHVHQRGIIPAGTIPARVIPQVATLPAAQSPNDALQVPQPGLAFLLSTLGWHSHALWSERLARLR